MGITKIISGRYVTEIFFLIPELRSGPFFLLSYEKGQKCWEDGCDYEESKDLCRLHHGSIATINNIEENRMIRELTHMFGEFHPTKCSRDFPWFYIGLLEEKRINGDSHYRLDGGSNSTFKNW